MNHPLRTAILLLFSAGFMDAFTYLAFGHVFANAMSGNVVQIAVSLPLGNWPEIYRHLPPLAAFFPGILAARWLLQSATFTGGISPSTAVLTIQLLLLLVTAAGIEHLPAFAVTACIAFMSAMQNTTFRSIGPVSYTSVVTTGNLRSLGEAVFGWIGARPTDRSQHREAAKALACICLAFAAGAATGAVLTHRLHRQAIWAALAILLLALTNNRPLSQHEHGAHQAHID